MEITNALKTLGNFGTRKAGGIEVIIAALESIGGESRIDRHGVLRVSFKSPAGGIAILTLTRGIFLSANGEPIPAFTNDPEAVGNFLAGFLAARGR